jgi:hypothetical protein
VILTKVAAVYIETFARHPPFKSSASLSWQSHHLNSTEGRCRLANRRAIVQWIMCGLDKLRLIVL